MPDPKLILDHVYDHEASQPERVFLTQPVGGGDVVDYTWGRTVGEARRMAAHLQSLGIAPGARIAMITKNCAHFLIAELAIWMAGGTTVAIFPTETAEHLRYVLEHSEASAALRRQARAVAAAGRGRAGGPALHRAAARARHLVRSLGRDRRPHRTAARAAAARRRRPGDDLLHVGIDRPAQGCDAQLRPHHAHHRMHAGRPERQLPAGVPWRAISYLPLSHIYERAVVACRCLQAGDGQIFFSDSLETFLDDVKRARPTVFVSVPRLWLKFQQGVLQKMPAEKLDALLADPATAAATGRQVLASLGLAEVCRASSGAAPIPPSLLAWYRRLGLPLIEGYGMTEDFAYSHRTTNDFKPSGHVGVASPGVQVRIADDGEVLIKSPGQMVGYYKRPDLNAVAFTDDGYFRTGDMGELAADGQLKLTGRVKELFKTAKGKYVAPAPIEGPAQRAPDGRAGHRLGRRPAAALRAGGAG